MPNRDIYEAVAAIMCPLPDQDSFLSNDQIAEDDRSFVFGEAYEQAERERAAFLNNLREAADLAHERDEEFDPLLETIDECRSAMDAAERRMRLLVAYAREFVRPQPYQLKDLARVAGLSISGVRIAYDEDEVRDVADRTGAKPRRPWPESES